MRIAVDVKKVVQEIDLDTGETHNYLVFKLGQSEHRVPASEQQLQEAIVEAQVHQHRGNGGTREMTLTKAAHAHDVLEHAIEYGDDTGYPAEEEYVEEERNDIVDSMLSDDVSEDELNASVLAHAQSVFAEVGAPVTEEELAEYRGQGNSVLPLHVRVSSDEESEGGTFQEIMEKPQGEAQKSAKGYQETIAALRARAKTHPRRGLPPHQVDEAGNPAVPPKRAPTGFAKYSDPSQPTVRVAGPRPSPMGDDDGFEQG